MKKILFNFLVLFAFVCGVNNVFAYEVKDIKADDYAVKEIAESIVNGYLTVDENENFNPDNSLSRASFLKGLIKVLKEEKKSESKSNFTDINENSEDFESIITAQDLNIIYGYPDKTFKPKGDITKSEASSILGHISKGDYDYLGILDSFKDAKQIPTWARKTTAKAVKNGYYVAYPNRDVLNPNKKLTKREAAILYSKVQKSLNLIDDKYRKDLVSKPQLKLIATETLFNERENDVNQVDIYNTKNVIREGNILRVKFDNKIKHKQLKKDDVVIVSVSKPLVTEQGTVLYDENAKFEGKVKEFAPSSWRGLNSRALVVFDKLNLSDGKVINTSLVPLTYQKKILWIFKTRQLVKISKKAKVNKKISKKAEKIEQSDILTRQGDILNPKIRYNIKKDTEIYLLLRENLEIDKDQDKL